MCGKDLNVRVTLTSVYRGFKLVRNSVETKESSLSRQPETEWWEGF